MEHPALDRACRLVANLALDVAGGLDKAARTRATRDLIAAGRALHAASEALASAEFFGCDTSEDASAYEGALAAYQGVCTALGVAPATLVPGRPTVPTPPQRPYPELVAEAAARAAGRAA